MSWIKKITLPNFQDVEYWEMSFVNYNPRTHVASLSYQGWKDEAAYLAGAAFTLEKNAVVTVTDPTALTLLSTGLETKAQAKLAEEYP